MTRYEGKVISEGIAIGRIYIYEKDKIHIKPSYIENLEDVENEINKFHTAKASAELQLDELYENSVVAAGGDNAEIFQVHKMLINDLSYNECIISFIREEKITAEYAITKASKQFSEMFENMDDDYMKARATDIRDVSDRIIRQILKADNNSEEKSNIKENIRTDNKTDNKAGSENYFNIIYSEELTPSDTISLNNKNTVAFVVKMGSANSHTAILARSMNIPALTNIDISKENDGALAIIDGYNGVIFINPDKTKIEEYKELKKQSRLKIEQNKETAKETIKELFKEKDGTSIEGNPGVSKGYTRIYANINKVLDVVEVLQNNAEGIGLFRSEFLYLGRENYPSEEEQFDAYKTVAKNMQGLPVIIRTMDIGADKQAEYFNIKKEENPAMGLRGIRICLDRPDLFKTQLRAIYRASVYGNISVMFPMIVSVEEIRKIKEIVREVKSELHNENKKFSDVKLGIMIETPAAAIISDLLAKEVDFFSIGTNDLTQYTLAADRQNPEVENIYNPHHPAILRLIKLVVDNGHKEGIKVGICGELAADTTLTEYFVKIGIDELSVPAVSIPAIKIKLN